MKGKGKGEERRTVSNWVAVSCEVEAVHPKFGSMRTHVSTYLANFAGPGQKYLRIYVSVYLLVAILLPGKSCQPATHLILKVKEHI